MALRSDLILHFVCVEFNVRPKILLGKERSRSLLLPRYVAALLLREDAHLYFHEIGRILGGMERSSMNHSCAQAKQLITDNESVAQSVSRIRISCAQAAARTAQKRKQPAGGFVPLSGSLVPGQKFPTQAILEAVCGEFGIMTDQLLGHSKKTESAIPRRIAMFLIHTELQKPLAQVARKFKVHRTTAFAACTKVMRVCEQDSDFRDRISKIRDVCAAQAMPAVMPASSVQPSAAS